jgi:hypothetical protein
LREGRERGKAKQGEHTWTKTTGKKHR